MFLRLKLAHWLAVAMSMLLCTAAVGDLYWCQGDGKSSLLEVKPLGQECSLVQKGRSRRQATPLQDDSPPNALVNNIPDNNELRPNRERNATDRGFPFVEDWEQGDRDEIRAGILRQELVRERKQMTVIRQRLLAGAVAVEKNFLQRRLRNHIQNVKSLQQELGRL